jgi:ATP-dependent Clp protease ATP-binding subunit ClpC
VSTLTAGADLAWKLAASEATAGGHPLIENALLLVGILSLETIDETPAHQAFAPDVRRAVEDEARGVAEVLARCGLEAASLRRLLRDLAGPGGRERRSETVSRSPACRETFYRAAMLSGPAGVSALDLMAALGEAPDAVVARALREGGTSVERLREEARRAERERRAARAAGRAGAPGTDPAAARLAGESPVETGTAATPRLESYGRDLTALAARGELGPVIGRRAELMHVLLLLARGSWYNPVLVGEPGVGKTAIVEALAIRGARGKDPAVLGGKRIVELSLPGLIGGTKDPRALEERVRRVLAEARARPELIVFMDELHTFVAGVTGGAVWEEWKAALARGEMRLIGATTSAEYRKLIESDPGWERSFEKVSVAEPGQDEAFEILTGLRPHFEMRHRVVIDDAALLAAVVLSVRFDPDHNLPAKAIDLVDRAAARTRAPLLTIVRSASPGSESPDEPTPPRTEGGDAPGRVTERTVSQVQAEIAHLPLGRMAEGLGGMRRLRILQVEPFLRKRILGQDRAIARIGRQLRLALPGPRDPEGPLVTLLFLGPVGVGKTETARSAASFLYGSEKALHRFDMSELTDEKLVWRLRTIPEAVVLFENPEKAHPRALDLLHQVLASGRLMDGNGRTADIRQAIFVITSSFGSEEVRPRPDEPGPPEPEGPAAGAALTTAQRFLPADLFNWIDDVIAFRALRPEDAVRILRQRLRVLCEAVERQHGVRLEVEPEAEDFIARTGFDPACGVRELPRVVERLVEAPLSSLILDGKIRKYAAWRVAYDEGGIYVVPRGG